MGESAASVREAVSGAVTDAVSDARGRLEPVIAEAAETASEGVSLAQEAFYDDRDEATRKADGRFSKVIVVSAVVAITLFVAATFLIEVLNIVYGSNVQLPAEVTVGYFAFWTVEVVMLASIRRSKIKNKFEYTEGEYKR